MGYQENEEVYLTLSRKELQGLCRKHGLPTNHSKSELAKMLVIHFTVISCLKSHTKKPISKKRQRKGSGQELERNQSIILSEENWEDNDGVKEQQGKCLLYPGREPNSKNFQRVKCRNKSFAECSSETGFVYSPDAPADAPVPFEFFVRSEEGLNLYIDFNSKILDWINSLKAEVSIHNMAHLDKSWTISDGVRDAFVDGRSLESPGVAWDTNLHSRNESRLQEHEFTNQAMPSSSMTGSYVHNCTAASCSPDVEMPLQNSTNISASLPKNSDSLARGSSNENIGNTSIPLDTDARNKEQTIMKAIKVSPHGAISVSLDDSLNSTSKRSAFPLSGKDEVSSVSSDNEYVENLEEACKFS